MKVTELRIGNLVYLFGEAIQLTKEHLIYLLGKDGTPEPITLTEEWLLKLGFKEDEPHLRLAVDRQKLGEFDRHDWQILYDQYGKKFQLFIKGLGMAGFLDIQYVHQLQNLYFALTGDELEVLPK